MLRYKGVGMSSLNNCLIKPVMVEQTDIEKRIKNNLIAFSIISIFMFYGDLSISNDSSILGLKFNGLTQDKIYIGLFLIVAYSFVHYAWYIKDAFNNWRLRRTAVISFKTGVDGLAYSSPAAPDERDATFYHWWVYHKKLFEDRVYFNDGIESALKEIQALDLSNESKLIYADNIINLCQSISLMTGAFSNSAVECRKLVELLNSSPFSDALKNFDGSFSDFLVSQNNRWLVFECLIPFALGFSSLCCIYLKLDHIVYDFVASWF